MLNIKNEVLWRVYLVAGVIFSMAAMIFFQLTNLAIVEGDVWRERAKKTYIKTQVVSAQRGNILDVHGNLLATSLPFFNLRFDPQSEGISDAVFMENVDSLALCIQQTLKPEADPIQIRDWLLALRANKDTAQSLRYVHLADNVGFQVMKKVKEFPIFRLGRFKGGLIIEQQSKRDRPYKVMAQRTIGYVREGAMPVGLEGRFDHVLGGVLGKQLVMRLPGNVMIPVNDLDLVDPKAGSDLVTTLDVNIQDVAQNALLNALKKHNADHGCAIVMDVKTGAIRALANLGRTEDGGWWETYNYGVGERVEPGSMFKTASFLAMLEDEIIEDFNQKVPAYKGKKKFYEETLVDAEPHNLDSMTVAEVFAKSSNVGTASLVQAAYGDTRRAAAFVDHFKDFGLDLMTGVELDGEEAPFFKEVGSKQQDWSGTSLPWMSIGYELLVSPLQMLQFYNAIANDGRMMKPYIVDRVERYGKIETQYHPKVVKKSIASKESIAKIKELLGYVVAPGGTAHKIQPKFFSIAGKTGTTQLNYHKFKTKKGIKHQASFCGFFPAENPTYSCIVVISEPQQAGYHGAEAAAPVFREIADRCFALQPEAQKAVNDGPRPALKRAEMPLYASGKKEDLEDAMKWLKIRYEDRATAEYAVTTAQSDTFLLESRAMSERKVPSLIGMGLMDALYIIENLGLHARISGTGRVGRQSIAPGTTANGQNITLFLE